jgi:hypothetical protein
MPTYLLMSPQALYRYFCLLLCLTGVLQAELKPSTTGKRPPIPNNAAVSVVRGQLIEIPLTATCASSREVVFSVIEPPLQGKLLDKVPVQAGQQRATIRYQAAADGVAVEDSLGFTCRIGDGPVSATGKITISFIDLKPELIADVVTVDFGSVRYGNEEERTVAIRNVGTGAYDGQVLLPEGSGWLLPEGTQARKISLPANGSMALSVRYRPRTLGEKRDAVSFTGSPLQVDLRAVGTAPYAASPTMFLTYERGKAERQSALRVQNMSPEALQVDFRLGTQQPDILGALEFPNQVALAPFEEKNVPIRLVKHIHGHYRATLELSSIGARQEVSVGSDPSPADLVLAGDITDGGLDFGAFSPGEQSKNSKTLIIKNYGGTEARLYGSLPQNFVCQQWKNGLEIPAGGEVQLPIYVSDAAFGKLLEAVLWTQGTQEVRFSLRADIALKAGGGSIFGKPGDSYSAYTENVPIWEASEADQIRMIKAQHTGLLPGELKVDPKLSEPTDFKMDSNTEDSITISWLPLEGDDWNYSVLYADMQYLQPKTKPGEAVVRNTSRPSRVWTKLEKLPVNIVGGRAVTTLPDIKRPNYSGTLAVLGTNAKGISTNLSNPAQVRVLPTQPFDWGSLFWPGVVCLALLAFILWRRRARRYNYQRTYYIDHADTSGEALVVEERL